MSIRAAPSSTCGQTGLLGLSVLRVSSLCGLLRTDREHLTLEPEPRKISLG